MINRFPPDQAPPGGPGNAPFDEYNTDLGNLVNAILGKQDMYGVKLGMDPLNPMADVPGGESGGESGSDSGGGGGGGGGVPAGGGSKAAGIAKAAASGSASGIYGPLIQGGLGLIAGLLGVGQPQQRQSFANTTADPIKTVTGNINAEKAVANALAHKMQKGVTLRGVAPAVPGLSVSDPALADKSLLSYPGLDLPDDLFGGGTTSVPRKRVG